MKPNRFKKIVAVLLATVTLGSASAMSASAALIEANAPGYSQRESNWCWAACIQTAVYPYKFPASQADYATFLWGSPLNYAALMWEVRHSMSSVSKVDGTLYGSFLSWATLTNEINCNRPFIVRTGNHAVAVTGYENALGQLYVMDPAYGHKSQKSYNQYKSIWNETIYETYQWG